LNVIDASQLPALNADSTGGGSMSQGPVVRVVVIVCAGVAAVIALVAIQPPAWIVLLLGSMALAGLYIYARMHSRYDPLDPRFGSCVPPLPRPKDQ
jgi:hypothetical protein